MNTKQTDLLNEKEIGKILASARKTAKISQEQMATMLGVDRRTISAYEQGRRRIHAKALLSFAKILNISLDDLNNQEFTKLDGRTRFATAIKELEQMPTDKQKAVFNLIDSMASSK